jgi:hypothetical protein
MQTFQLREEKAKEPSGNAFFAFNLTLLKRLATLWNMDCSKVFFEIPDSNKCHKDVATPHAVIVGHDFSDINIFVDFTLVLRNLTFVQAIPAIIALHYCTNVHYDKSAHLLLELMQKQVCTLSPKEGTHKPGKENCSMQSAEIESYQKFIGNYLYKKYLAEGKQ